MWRVIRKMYKGTENCVIIGDDKTEFFKVEAGVRQGCVLSPILFSIYINGLAKQINRERKGITIGGNHISILMYADDIVLVADNRKDLQKLMDIVTNWGKKWRCTYNKTKSEVVVFGSNKKEEGVWSLWGEEIAQEDWYKYLGLDIKGNRKWGKYKCRLLEKAKKRLAQTWGMGIQSGALTVRAAEKVWKAIVRPIVEYGAEVWGEEGWEEAEKLQREMGKRILGLNESTNNVVVLGELGWWTMKARRDMMRLRYWRKLLNMGQERLPRRAYEWEIRRKERNWSTYTEELLKELDLGEHWERQEVRERKKEWNEKIRRRIQTREEAHWWRKVEESDKLRTYRTVKTKLIWEEYLKIDDEKGRKEMAKIRSGTNELRIETGRYEDLREEERQCWFGCDEIEDEEHFLMKCSMYEDIRRRTRDAIGEDIFRRRGREIMLGKGSTVDVEQAIRYIKGASARRRRILEYKDN